MNVPVHHHDDRQSNTHLRCRHHHYKEYKQLPLCSRRRIGRRHFQVMHFREGHQQQVHRIQHQLYAHKDDDRVPARQYPYDADAEQGEREEYVIINGHLFLFINKP